MKKQDTGWPDKINSYPQRKTFSHPIIIRSTISGAILAGIIIATIAWLLSAQATGIENSIRITSLSSVIFASIGFIAGCAVGGLIGNVLGIFLMLKEKS